MTRTLPLIFVALLIALMSGVILAQSWWCGLGLCLLIIRCGFLGQPGRYLSQCLIILLLSGLWFGWIHEQRQQRHWSSERSRTILLIVQPDQVRVDGDGLTVVGRATDGQTIRAFCQIESSAQARFLQQLRAPMSWQIDGVNIITQGPRNRNQFDQRPLLAAQGIDNQLRGQRWQVATIQLSWWEKVMSWPHEMRQRFRLALRQLPPTLSEYASDLLIGETATNFYDHQRGIKQLGLVHLFSISGMHVVYLLGLVRLIFTLSGLTREKSQLLLAAGLPVYGIIAGGASTLVRAILIGELTLLLPFVQHWFPKANLTRLDAWSVSLIGGLVIQPFVLQTLGGQLSYLMAFTLLYVQHNHPIRQTVLLNLTCLPLLLHQLFQVHLLSTPVNLLLVPIFGWTIFPMVILGTILSPVAPWFGQGCDWLLINFSQLINYLGELPGMIIFGRLPTGWLWACLLVSLLLVDAQTKSRRRRLAIKLVVLYATAFLILHCPFDGEVSFLDIGQGDSILLRSPFNRHVSLIDTGGRVGFLKPAWAKRKTTLTNVEQVTVNYLHSRGISKIDEVNCSHQDADHIGDVGRLLQLMPVRRLTIPAGMTTSRGFQRKVAPYLKQTQVVELTTRSQLTAFPFTIYHPFNPGPGGNEDSVVLGATRNQQRFLFMGDLDRHGELSILHQFPDIQVDVLKLGHHGSDTASDPEFIHRVRPKLAIISAGLNNRYGHPKASTLATLRKERITGVNTADVGEISYNYQFWGASHWQTMLPLREPSAGSPKQTT